MNIDLEKTVLKEAKYMLENDATIREIAKNSNRSKSSIHKDLQVRLEEIDFDLYEKVQKVLKKHLEIRHIRGGESTKQKYAKMV